MKLCDVQTWDDLMEATRDLPKVKVEGKLLEWVNERQLESMSTQDIQWKEVQDRAPRCVFLSNAMEMVRRGMSREQAMTYTALILSNYVEKLTGLLVDAESIRQVELKVTKIPGD